MHQLKTNNAPHSSVVVPHFVFAAFSLLLLAVMLLLSQQELLQAYFNSKLVAITHIAILGWATMIVFGALYQLVPVVFETALYSEKLAKVTFWLTSFSVLFLSYSFWVGAYSTYLTYAAMAMFLSLFLFVINIVLSYKKSKVKNIKSLCIITAIFWLLITEFIGTLIALHFKFNFLSQVHLFYLKIHATVGLVGWFLLLIIGVGATLLPMFLISHNVSTKKLKLSYSFINLGLLTFVLNSFFIQNKFLSKLSIILITIGVLFFILFVFSSYKKRLRKKLDIGMKYSMLAIAALLIPIVLFGIAYFMPDSTTELVNKIIILYGFSVIFGFVTTLILGQTYKTLPFIVWLTKYKKWIGKVKTPLPRQLYSEKIANLQFYSYLVFVTFMLLGLVFNNALFIKIGSFSLLFVAVLYLINVLKIIFHSHKNKTDYYE